jgi:rhodanese-related sulfurtransferase
MAFLFGRKDDAPYKNLTVAEYREKFGTAPHALIDVRTVGEYEDGHLPGAVNIPLDQLGRRLAEVPHDKPIIVVCATGSRSKSGSSIIARAGRTEVYNLQGGTMAWMMQRLPLE